VTLDEEVVELVIHRDKLCYLPTGYSPLGENIAPDSVIVDGTVF
jgi:hypothetical protein